MAASTLKVKAVDGHGVGLRAKAYDRDTVNLATNGTSSASVEGPPGTYTFTFTDLATNTYDLRITTVADLTVASGLFEHTNAVGIEYPAGVVTLLSRVTSTLFAGITSLGGWLRIMSRKDAAAATDYATSQNEINANGGSGAGGFANTAESLEAIAGSMAHVVSQQDDPVDGDDITLYRGNSISFNLTNLGSLVGRTKLWVTGKQTVNDPDSTANFMIEETAGLLRIGGAVPAAGETGAIAVTDAVAGHATVTMSVAAAYRLKLIEGGVWDSKKTLPSGTTSTVPGVLNIRGDVTRAIA